MLTRLLYLSAIWFALSLLVTLVVGSRLRRGDFTLSLLWMVAIIFMGNIIALLTFGQPFEVFGLSWFAFAFGLVWATRLRDWNATGQVTWSMTLLTTGLFLIYTFVLTAFSPLNPLSFIFALIFFFLEFTTLLLALAHMFESLDVICRVHWHRLFEKLEPIPGYAPVVSLHVPAYNEPVEIVQRTLNSLSRLDYPNFEVLVLDNNTPLEETWRPLEEICRQLGPRFHCLHLDKWPGYKSGALNFAVSQTDPRAEIISIIDSDYEVAPDFLKELVPAFADPNMAFIQTPQDYSDSTSGVFSQSTYRSYKYFFEVSMPSRNERNAIIFAGTMGLIRKSVLEEIGGWDEWCITEDAEASLRILKRGYQSLYINKAYGRGLMPFNFEGLKKQRFRWCFGGIQLLKKHWEALMPWGSLVDPGNKLTLAQRYYYLVGGLGWFSDVFNLLFALFLVLGAVFSIFSSPVQIRPLTDTILILPAIFLFLHILRFLWVLRNRLKISFGMAVATMYNFFSLGWAVTLACIQGLVQREGVFLRTPKSKTTSRTWHAIHVTQWETTIGLICLLAGSLAYLTNQNWRTVSLFALLVWQGSLYLAAPVFSLLSMGKPEALLSPVPEQGSPIQEQRAAGWVVVVSMILIAAFSLIKILPSPTQLPGYAQYLPPDVSFQKASSTPESLTTKTPIATVAVDSANCRKKPRGGDNKVALFYRGQKLEVVGRNADLTNTWWYVKVPNSDAHCWLWGLSTTITGSVDKLPIIE
ncbi:MAG TPA: glycosyltransferase [Anaerolineales bacterium]|jgi:cellulose synthase/poly-beta-1,6-N-acetylglucosamine synthase-like glycosyltransferase